MSFSKSLFSLFKQFFESLFSLTECCVGLYPDLFFLLFNKSEQEDLPHYQTWN